MTDSKPSKNLTPGSNAVLSREPRLPWTERQPWRTFRQIVRAVKATRLDPKTETGLRATLLGGLLFFLLVLGSLGQLEFLGREGGFSPYDLVTVVAFLFLALLFVLNKRGYFLFSVICTISIMIVGIYAIFWAGDRSATSSNILVYLVLPILLTEFFLPFRAYVLTVVVTAGSMLLISPTDHVINIFVLLMIFATLLSVFTNNQRKLDLLASARLEQSHQELIAAYDDTIVGWSAAMDLRDRETEGHSQRVADLTVKLCRAMNFAEGEIVSIHRGALLHDIGKLGIPDEILHKPGPLTDAEWETMRKHPTFAADMLAGISYLRAAVEIPYGHHERWDGSGYPRGLKGEAIPRAARVFAVVDVCDALTSNRPYRDGWKASQALDYIQEQSGKLFDPQVVRAFLKFMKENYSLEMSPAKLR
jgi:hypothetical protein